MADTLFLIFTYFTEALIVFSYSKSIYEVKKNSIFSFTIITLSYFLLLLIYNFVFNQELFNTILIITINILLFLTLYKSSLKSAIFHGFALGILQLVSEFLAVYIFAIALNTESQNVISEHFETATLFSRILYFSTSRILVLFSSRENKSKSWGKWFGLSLLPMSSILIVIAFRLITNHMVLSTIQNTFLISSISVLFLVNIAIYMIYEQAEKSNQKLIELEMTSQKNEIDLQYLNLLEKKNETMQIMTHDYKKHITIINSMTDSPEIKEYVNEMLDEISQYSQICRTKNKILDVILSKYIDVCKEKNIDFDSNVVTDNLSFISNKDISALFNNILDNAVEAAEKSSKRMISLQISNSLNSYHKIILTNSCDIEPLIKNGKLITTKKKREIHGFGTKSIEKVVNKYNGEIEWKYDIENKQFTLLIIIPVEQ